MTISKKDHWENIYHSKPLNEVSWYQLIPKTSLNFIESCSLQRNSPIIDVGGGDSFLSGAPMEVVENLQELVEDEPCSFC